MKVLHLLSQRPSLTGSGVTLDAIVRNAAARGWDQAALVGVPADAAAPAVGELSKSRVRTVRFAADNERARIDADVDYPLPGMSDVMPYRSSRFSALTPEQLRTYRRVWRTKVTTIVEEFAPDVVHVHHVWLLSGIAKAVCGNIPVVAHGHGTDLRQLELCPHLAPEVVASCQKLDAVVALHRDHQQRYAEVLDWSSDRVHVVGAGYRDELFHARRREAIPGSILFAGKLSYAKGLPELLDAFEVLAGRRSADRQPLRLHIAGGGEGPEADAIRARLDAMKPQVELHGRLDHQALAALMRRCAVFALPSYYEGLALVLVEAYASGARLVSTALPGVCEAIAPVLGEALHLVPLPPMATVDRPQPAAVPEFVERLADALEAAVDAPPLEPNAETARNHRTFTWGSVFERIERVWLRQRR